MAAFSAEVFHNEFLAPGSTQVHAIVTVSSTGSSGRRLLTGGRDGTLRVPAAQRVEILLLDCSGSMVNPPTKIRQAVAAATAAVDSLPDGTWFAIVRGTGTASMVYPKEIRLVRADADTRVQARLALSALHAHGGTAIGRWLTLARQLAATVPDAIGHAILLTDGQNGELFEDFDAAVGACVGAFQCDCRGIGTDWRVSELRAVATSLLGTVDAVPDPADLAAEFSDLVRVATRRATDSVSLRVWTPTDAKVATLCEVAPTLRDLTGESVSVDGRTRDYRTGAWGVETRDYHLHVEVPARDVGTEMLAARVGLVIDDQVVSTALVPAIWTADDALSMRTSAEVAHYTGQVELARVVREGLEARRSGDETAATLMLGRGAQLALDLGNEATYRLLQKVVDIDNPTTGTVRLKKNVEKIDEMVLETRSTMTVRVNR